VGYLPDSFVI